MPQGSRARCRSSTGKPGLSTGTVFAPWTGRTEKALSKVRQKYFDEFLQKDLHFFLGTTQQFHSVAPNPWVIIGVLPIPHERQMGLFG
jgi:hypothetical protein